MLTIDQVAAFDRDGFVVVEGMFSQEEADVLLKAVGEASRVDAHTFEARDVDGNVSKLSLWTDIWGRCFRGSFSESSHRQFHADFASGKCVSLAQQSDIERSNQRWGVGMASRLRLLVS